MKCFVLASGSEGNVTYVDTGKEKILIDMGRNNKYITEALSKINVSASEIDVILLSHSHHDHTEALKVFLNKNHPVVYVGRKMLTEIDSLKDYDNLAFYDEDNFNLNGVKVSLIKTSHDVIESFGFILDDGETSLVQITDTGYLNIKYLDILRNRDYYIFESNHDIEMIINGPYPDYLKARITGPQGHLSNKESAIYLTKMIGENTKKVVLAHISRHNNTPEIAKDTCSEILKEYDINFSNIVTANTSELTEVVND